MITVTVLIYLVGYILIHGVPYLRPSLFSLTYNSDNVSMMLSDHQHDHNGIARTAFSVPFGIERQFILSNMQKRK